jgi:hypothetical protein
MDLLSVSFSIIVFKLTLRLLNNETNSLKFTRLEDPSPSSCPLHENSCLHKKIAISIRLDSSTIFSYIIIKLFYFYFPSGGNVLFTKNNEFTSRSNMLFTLIVLLCAHPKFFKSEYPAFVQIVSLFVTNTNRIHGQQKSF